MARLNEMLEAFKALKTDRRLSYLGPQGEDDEEEGVPEGTYTEEDFLKEAKHNPKQLFDFVYRRQTYIVDQYDRLYRECEEAEQERDPLHEDFDALKAE